jgi:8-oxo-dGTP diphosphatase
VCVIAWFRASGRLICAVSMDEMSNAIQIRVCLAVVASDKLLLVPHYRTDAGAVQWVVPGGKVEFGESLQEAAVREFFEETGLQAEVTGLLHVSEVIIPDRPYHSITISFSGRVTGGELRAEADHPFGEKVPRRWSAEEVKTVKYHPEPTVEKALGIRVD